MIITKTKSQNIISARNLEELNRKIKECYDQNYIITDVDYGNGIYRAVMSRGTGWGSQKIILREDFVEEEIGLERLNEGYMLTSMAYDYTNWIFVLTKNTGINGQVYVLQKDPENFRNLIKGYWSKKFIVTTLSCVKNEMIAILSSGLYWGQSYYHHLEIPKDDLITKKNETGAVIVDICEFPYDTISLVLCNNTGFNKQRYHENSDFGKLMEMAHNRWEEHYIITGLSYLKSKWAVIFTKQ